MVSVYNDADYLSAHKQKQRLFYIFMGVTLVYLAFCISWWIYFMSLPYAANKFWPKACVYTASVLYTVFAFIYLAIPYSRVRRYYKMLSYVCEGLKTEEKNFFYSFREKSLQKENIDVVSCIFETWNKKKQEWMEREVYVDAEKPLPAFESGDYIRYITQSNFIIKYEVLQKQALEFEEEDEEYEEYEEYEEETATQEQENQGEEQ
ncbi:MAG: hypothetical protein IJ514_01615 [Clostridia bacterium]|nr:hypothetical protein [Clostridia bacterium]